MQQSFLCWLGTCMVGCSPASPSVDPSPTEDSDPLDQPSEHDPGNLACHDAFPASTELRAHHHDLVEWRSEDGTTWTEHRLFQTCADVASLASDGAGEWLVAFQNFQDGDDGLTIDRVGMRRSSDAGETWGAPYGVTFAGLPEGAARPFDPTIVWVPALSRWRMYFSMNTNGTMTLDSSVCTFSAVSEDGRTFTFEEGTRYCAENGPVIDPAVGLLDDTWVYIAPRGAPQDGGHLATSEDGLHFVVEPVLPSGAHHNWTGNLVGVGETLRFYGGESLYVSENFLWWAESSDGVTWSDFERTDIPAGKDPALMYEDGTYVILVPTVAE